MRKIIIAASAVAMTAGLFAAPVSATTLRPADLDAQIDQLGRQIDGAAKSDAISSREVSRLERQVDQIVDLQIRYDRGTGFTKSELRFLGQRIDKVGQQLATVAS
jgi:hypothetical protein